jgi:DNA invertase Pin-like site-specific DNA recombinase
MDEKLQGRPKGVLIVLREYATYGNDFVTIAKRTGYSLATVRKYLSQYSIPYKRTCKYNGVKLTSKTLQIINHLLAGCWASESDIARANGVSRQWVHVIKKKYLKEGQ